MSALLQLTTDCLCQCLSLYAAHTSTVIIYAEIFVGILVMFCKNLPHESFVVYSQ